MAKSKSRPSTQLTEKKPTNPIANQFYGVRSEVRKVTWPTREEAQQLTIAVTIGTVVIAIFLFMFDFLFEAIIAGIVSSSAFGIGGAVAVVILLGAAFYANSREE